jgi:hypothetical protein
LVSNIVAISLWCKCGFAAAIKRMADFDWSVSGRCRRGARRTAGRRRVASARSRIRLAQSGSRVTLVEISSASAYNARRISGIGVAISSSVPTWEDHGEQLVPLSEDRKSCATQGIFRSRHRRNIRRAISGYRSYTAFARATTRRRPGAARAVSTCSIVEAWRG